MAVLLACRDDQLAGSFAGCTVMFEADLLALRDAIHQFGRVTTSQSFPADDCQSVLDGCSHTTDDQVPLPQLLST